MILQLNPPLPVITPLGQGFAIAVIDYYAVSMNTVWVVALKADGQFKHFTSEQVRLEPDKMHGVSDNQFGSDWFKYARAIQQVPEL